MDQRLWSYTRTRKFSNWSRFDVQYQLIQYQKATYQGPLCLYCQRNVFEARGRTRIEEKGSAKGLHGI